MLVIAPILFQHIANRSQWRQLRSGIDVRGGDKGLSVETWIHWARVKEGSLWVGLTCLNPVWFS